MAVAAALATIGPLINSAMPLIVKAGRSVFKMLDKKPLRKVHETMKTVAPEHQQHFFTRDGKLKKGGSLGGTLSTMTSPTGAPISTWVKGKIDEGLRHLDQVNPTHSDIFEQLGNASGLGNTLRDLYLTLVNARALGKEVTGGNVAPLLREVSDMAVRRFKDQNALVPVRRDGSNRLDQYNAGDSDVFQIDTSLR